MTPSGKAILKETRNAPDIEDAESPLVHLQKWFFSILRAKK